MGVTGRLFRFVSLRSIARRRLQGEALQGIPLGEF